jgi:hypothetical protein
MDDFIFGDNGIDGPKVSVGGGMQVYNIGTSTSSNRTVPEQINWKGGGNEHLMGDKGIERRVRGRSSVKSSGMRRKRAGMVECWG